MKSFMSSALNDTKPLQPSTECGTCSTQAVAAKEDVTATEPEVKVEQDQLAPAKEPEATVVMSGPLGTLFTEALNKTFAKKAIGGPVQVPAVESLSINNVQANGQILNPESIVGRTSQSVGLVPKTDSAPTAVNTLLSVARAVDDIEWLLIDSVDGDPSNPNAAASSRNIVALGENKVGLESLVVESVQVVVRYKKI